MSENMFSNVKPCAFKGCKGNAEYSVKINHREDHNHDREQGFCDGHASEQVMQSRNEELICHPCKDSLGKDFPAVTISWDLIPDEAEVDR